MGLRLRHASRMAGVKSGWNDAMLQSMMRLSGAKAADATIRTIHKQTTNVTPSTTSMAVAILLRYPGAGLGGSGSAASMTGLHFATRAGQSLPCSQS